MNTQTIQEQLKTLRLPVAADELEEVLTKHKSAVKLDWVADLFRARTRCQKRERHTAENKTCQVP